jgi:hypothetical protein
MDHGILCGDEAPLVVLFGSDVLHARFEDTGRRGLHTGWQDSELRHLVVGFDEGDGGSGQRKAADGDRRATALVGTGEDEDVLAGDGLAAMEDIAKDVYEVRVVGKGGGPSNAIACVPGSLLVMQHLFESGAGFGHVWLRRERRACGPCLFGMGPAGTG